jgi:hypothetical protein
MSRLQRAGLFQSVAWTDHTVGNIGKCVWWNNDQNLNNGLGALYGTLYSRAPVFTDLVSAVHLDPKKEL